MIAKLYSAALQGVDSAEVEVEVSSRDSEKSATIIVGLPDAAVRESAQRVMTALTASALPFGYGIQTVNLAPADLKKEGPSFDLPIALAMTACAQDFDLSQLTDDLLIVGELALDGTLRPVKGALSIALGAKERGRRRVLVPKPNAREAAMVSGVEVYGIENLHEAWKFVSGEKTLAPEPKPAMQTIIRDDGSPDFDEVKGQHSVKRALEIAAAGGHNILLLFLKDPKKGSNPFRIQWHEVH
ncbi:ATP-binding protein [Akkermansiaceae bacterium]|nr:ATP-binding protein [Akkermansiaceae bacterium]MDC0287346.1 ATP-binding protein [Akkermansiaceae bacterium]